MTLSQLVKSRYFPYWKPSAPSACTALAFHFEYQWWLLISAIAAPIILLRSPESKAIGVKGLGNYWDNQYPEWKDLSLTEKVLFRLIPLVTSGLLTWWLASWWLPSHTGLVLFWHSVALNLFAGVVAGVVVVVVVVAVSASKYKALQIPATIISLIVLAAAIAIGIWGRSLLIRILATVWHPLAGLRQLPLNWRETVAVVDFIHLPELLPGAASVSSLLTVRGWLEQVNSVSDKDSWIGGLIVLVWYPPALLWRWSLKATLWLWWPLALLLRPDKAMDNIGKVRKEAVTQIWVSGLLLWTSGLNLALFTIYPKTKPQNPSRRRCYL